VSLELIPCTLGKANAFVEHFDRHNGRTTRDSGKFAVACGNADLGLVAVAIVGNPFARRLCDGFTAEVLRCCSRAEAPNGANALLYRACWRAWRAMGGRRLITYTLATESGASLRGAGWRVVGEVKGGGLSRPNLDRVRRWQPIYGQQKLRWEMSE
jgi:hypothetical protein